MSTTVEVNKGKKKTQDLSVWHPSTHNIVMVMEKNMFKHQTPREFCDTSKHEYNKCLLIMNWGVMLGGGQLKS